MQIERTSGFHSFRIPTVVIIAVLFISLALIVSVQAASPLDPTFGNAGKVLTDFTNRMDAAYDMVIQPDGKFIVVGITTVLDNSLISNNFGIVRYNINGSLDTSFGTGGKVSTDFFVNYDKAFAVALQSDGKIVVVGSSIRNNPGPQEDFAIARYNSNGTLDATFGNGGKTTVDFASMEDEAMGVIIQPDNKIVIGGTARVINGPGHDLDFALVRLNSDGSLDTTFDNDGKVTTNLGDQFFYPNDNMTALALYPDGRILAGGSTNNEGDFAFVRYNPNGSLDTTFDTDGKVRTDLQGDNNSDALRAMVIQPDAKILAVGTSNINYGNGRGFALARYNDDGSLDPTFGGGDGIVLTPPGGSAETATDVALTSNGKIVVCGYGSGWSVMVMRYSSNGNLDLAFGAGGKLYSYLNNYPAKLNAVAIQADGKILVAGDTIDPPILNSTDNNFVIVRYLANPTVRPVRSDFDGDGRSDYAIFRPSNGTWYVLNSSNGVMRTQPFGANGDIATPGDYDGDHGVTDFAVFRPSTGAWYILNSSDGSFRAEGFGTSGDIPVPADYDGDTKTDIAVFRPSNGAWYIRRSSDNGFQAVAFGASTDRPIPGYYDDDEKVDIAVFRDSTAAWYILQSSNNGMRTQVWGQSGDIPVPADYGVKGNYDFAVFRPGEGRWYILSSTDGSTAIHRFGAAGDKPVVGDYTGDTVNEIALWRPNNGTWYLFYGTFGFGTTGDTPVLNAYLP